MNISTAIFATALLSQLARTGMGEDELALGQLRPHRLGERREPLLADVGLLNHERDLLPVDVDAVEVVAEHERRHRVGERRGVSPVRRRVVGRAEGGDDDGHARVVVLLLELLAACGVERGPVLRLVARAV